MAPAERSDLAMPNMEYEIKNEDIEALLKELGSDLKKRMPAGWRQYEQRASGEVEVAHK